MSSYGSRFDDQSTLNRRVGGSTGGSPVSADPTHLRLVRDAGDGSPAVLAPVAAAIEQVEQEIDHLWFDSMNAEDLAMSQRLAEVSHALQGVARLLGPDEAIG